MAEIIRAGRLPEEDWYMHTCTNCNTHFKFRKREVGYGDQGDPGYAINCPFCAKQCWMSSLKRYSDGTDPY